MIKFRQEEATTTNCNLISQEWFLLFGLVLLSCQIMDDWCLHEIKHCKKKELETFTSISIMFSFLSNDSWYV